MRIFQSARFSSKEERYLIAGLGNPGPNFIDTRHNVGFEMLDAVAAYFDITVKKLKCRAAIGEGRIAGKRVVLAKPQTYMNLSGKSIRDLCAFYKIPTERLIVIYDDVDLETARIRIREHGSAGGHNGMKNIIYQLGTEDFPRIRVGIGKPDVALVDYVLQKFSKNDVAQLVKVAKIMPQIVETILQDGTQAAMNKYNQGLK